MGTVDFQAKNASKMLNSPTFLVTKMPYSIPSNATLYHRKCHISFSEMPHFIVRNAIGFGQRSVAFQLLKCGIRDDEVWHFGW